MVAVEDVELHEIDVCHGSITVFELEVESFAEGGATLLPCRRVFEILGMSLEITDDA